MFIFKNRSQVYELSLTENQLPQKSIPKTDENKHAEKSQAYEPFFYEEACENLQKLIKLCAPRAKFYLDSCADNKSEIEKTNINFIPFCIFTAALTAELKWIEHAGRFYSAPLPWNTKARVPSLPTLASDAYAYAQYACENTPLEQKIFSSLLGWTEVFQETIECACESNNFSLKSIALSVYTHYAFSIIDIQKIIIKQYVGINSKNKAHMTHYENSSFVKPSKKQPRLAIVSIMENRLQIHSDNIAVNAPPYVSSNLFNLYEYTARIVPIIKNLIGAHA